jgi:hypothetical protein
MVTVHRGDGTGESVWLSRSYGRWEPSGQRLLTDPAGEQRIALLDGPLSDPFPSGDAIIPTTLHTLT